MADCEPMDTDDNDNVVPITRGTRPRMQIIFTPGPNSIEFQVQTVPNANRHAPRRPHPPTAIRGKLLQFRTAAQRGNENMNSFRIDENDRIERLCDLNDMQGAVFSSFEDLEQLISGWPMRRLVAIWNGLRGVRSVTRFENRRVAAQRIWQAMQTTSTAAPKGTKVTRAKRENKLQLVLRLLRAPDGITLESLMKATGWQAHSVRGFLSRKVSKQMSLPVESFRRDGKRVYRVPAAQ
jgi:hypothetical protein